MGFMGMPRRMRRDDVADGFMEHVSYDRAFGGMRSQSWQW